MNAQSEIRPPVETVIEFVFYGLFSPKNFEPSWLYRSEILHPREVKEVKEIRINEAEVFYSTDIISFNVTYDSLIIRTNSSLTYDSLLTIAKRIVNELKSNLGTAFNLNIRYHFKAPSEKKIDDPMSKLVNDKFLDGIIDNVTLNGASISKSIQQKEFHLNTDINISKCRREGSNGQLIHVFLRNYLDLDRLPNEGKGRRKTGNRLIGKFIRLDKELEKVLNRSQTLAKTLANNYFSDYG